MYKCHKTKYFPSVSEWLNFSHTWSWPTYCEWLLRSILPGSARPTNTTFMFRLYKYLISMFCSKTNIILDQFWHLLPPPHERRWVSCSDWWGAAPRRGCQTLWHWTPGHTPGPGWTPLLAGGSGGWAGIWSSSLLTDDHSAVTLVFQLLLVRRDERKPWVTNVVRKSLNLQSYLTASGITFPSSSQRISP